MILVRHFGVRTAGCSLAAEMHDCISGPGPSTVQRRFKWLNLIFGELLWVLPCDNSCVLSACCGPDIIQGLCTTSYCPCEKTDGDVCFLEEKGSIKSWFRLMQKKYPGSRCWAQPFFPQSSLLSYSVIKIKAFIIWYNAQTVLLLNTSDIISTVAYWYFIIKVVISYFFENTYTDSRNLICFVLHLVHREYSGLNFDYTLR